MSNIVGVGAGFGLVVSRLKRDGWTAVARRGSQRVSQRLGERLAWADLDFPLRQEDIADSFRLHLPQPVPVHGRKLTVGWVCVPPAPGSGGHTTLFRMVQGLEERGHRCVLFLYDRDSDNVLRHEAAIRRGWPGMRAQIRSATAGFGGVDAVVASSWSSAHVVASRGHEPVHRFYFIQDYEPYFYARGTLYALAEDTYRFGFHNIALGNMIGGVLESELGRRPATTVPFGCDTAVYHFLPTAPTRTGVVFYAKRHSDRRGYMLAKLGLEKFHQIHPEQEIHVYGDRVSGWAAPVTVHGSLTPVQLNSLYNRTIAGLSISFTNISLVPEEQLAAGNIPVLNESAFSRTVLSGSDAVWAAPTPEGIAASLSAVVSHPDIASRATAAAGRPRANWTTAQTQLTAFIEAVCAAG